MLVVVVSRVKFTIASALFDVDVYWITPGQNLLSDDELVKLCEDKSRESHPDWSNFKGGVYREPSNDLEA